MPAAVPTRLRREPAAFPAPWISVPGVVISASTCRSIDELAGRRVAVVNGSIWDEYLSSRPLAISLVRVEDVRTALELTAMSGVSAMVTNLATATDMIHKLGIGNLRIVMRLDRETRLSFGVRKDWPQLVTILNRTMAGMNPATREEIRHRWLKLGEPPWWQWHNSRRQRLFLILLTGLLLVIAFFIAWNRILKLQVRKRTDALQQAQRNLIRAAKMESVGRLAAGVAHEVKNPLAIIRMGVEFLAADPNRDPSERDVLADMEDAVERADQVIRGLLDYSRYSKLNLTPGDLDQVIRHGLRLVEHEIRKHRIKVVTELELKEPVAFDANRMQQVFINLFMNSIQAMPDGGTLTITSGAIRLSEAEAGLSDRFQPGRRAIRITVRDTGPGISPEDEGKIFDPFYTTKEIGQGTGLGLAESRNIVELHNGTLHLKNCPDHGACAVIILPCTQGEHP